MNLKREMEYNWIVSKRFEEIWLGDSSSRERPLLHAPKICPEMPGSQDFDANFAEWGKDLKTEDLI